MAKSKLELELKRAELELQLVDTKEYSQERTKIKLEIEVIDKKINILSDSNYTKGGVNIILNGHYNNVTLGSNNNIFEKTNSGLSLSSSSPTQGSKNIPSVPLSQSELLTKNRLISKIDTFSDHYQSSPSDKGWLDGQAKEIRTLINSNLETIGKLFEKDHPYTSSILMFGALKPTDGLLWTTLFSDYTDVELNNLAFNTPKIANMDSDQLIGLRTAAYLDLKAEKPTEYVENESIEKQVEIIQIHAAAMLSATNRNNNFLKNVATTPAEEIATLKCAGTETKWNPTWYNPLTWFNYDYLKKDVLACVETNSLSSATNSALANIDPIDIKAAKEVKSNGFFDTFKSLFGFGNDEAKENKTIDSKVDKEDCTDCYVSGPSL